jgi:hypothetical protein
MAGTGLQVMAAGDILGQFNSLSPTTRPNLLGLREAELGVFAPADYLFDAVAILAAHDEGGALWAEIHEVYIGSSKLIPHSRIRAGYYFLNFGRLNSFHRHDWPFISAPPTHARFFAQEAVTDGGFEYSWLVPFAPFYLDITAGVASGYTFGHAHRRGPTPIVPTHYVRALHYTPVGETSGMQWGLNYIGRKTDAEGQMTLVGLDWVAKFREFSQLRWFFQTEAWYRNQNATQELGGYFYSQYGIPDTRLELGVRLDAYSQLNLKNAAGQSLGNLEFGWVPQIAFKPSEFTQFRASYSTLYNLRGSSIQTQEHLLELQTLFILGAHPAHEF